MNDQHNENNNAAGEFYIENENLEVDDEFFEDDENYDEMYEEVLDSRASFTEYVTFLKKGFEVLQTAHSLGFKHVMLEKFPMQNYLKEMDSTCVSISELEDDLDFFEEEYDEEYED